METKKYGIKYLKMGKWTMASDKNDNMITFESVWGARKYMNNARNNDPHNPVTFMNRVDICELNEDGTVANVVEHY